MITYLPLTYAERAISILRIYLCAPMTLLKICPWAVIPQAYTQLKCESFCQILVTSVGPFLSHFIMGAWGWLPCEVRKIPFLSSEATKAESTFWLLAVDLAFNINSILCLLFSIISWVSKTTGNPSSEISFNECMFLSLSLLFIIFSETAFISAPFYIFSILSTIPYEAFLILSTFQLSEAFSYGIIFT